MKDLDAAWVATCRLSTFDRTLILFVRRRFITTYSGADKIPFKRNRVQHLRLEETTEKFPWLSRRETSTSTSLYANPPICTAAAPVLSSFDGSFASRFASRLVRLVRSEKRSLSFHCSSLRIDRTADYRRKLFWPFAFIYKLYISNLLLERGMISREQVPISLRSLTVLGSRHFSFFFFSIRGGQCDFSNRTCQLFFTCARSRLLSRYKYYMIYIEWIEWIRATHTFWYFYNTLQWKS